MATGGSSSPRARLSGPPSARNEPEADGSAVDPELSERSVDDPFCPRSLLQRDHVAGAEFQGRPAVDLKLPAALQDEQGFVRDQLHVNDLPGNRSWLPEPCLDGLVGTKQVDETSRLLVVLLVVRLDT